MSAWKSTIEGLPTLVKYLMVAGVVAIISFLFPNNVKFKYEFDKGQRWRYEDLRAPFDFAILKPEQEIEEERARIRDNFSPYYEVLPSITEEQIAGFQQRFDAQLSEVKAEQFPDVTKHPDDYRSFGKTLLQGLYDSGITELAPVHKDKPNDFVVNVLQGNTTHPQTLENLTTVPEAAASLAESLPYSKLAESDFLYGLLEASIAPNMFFNDTLSERLLSEELSQVGLYRGRVSKGDLIVTENGYITEEIYLKLASFKSKYREEVTDEQSYTGVLAGYALLTTLIIGIFLLYVRLYAQAVFSRFNKLVFIMLWLVAFSYLVYAVEQVALLSTYMIPFCIVPIVIKNFYDEQLALFTHLVVILLASFLSSLGYEFTFLQILAGIVVLLSDVDTRDWTRFFYSILYIFVVYFLGYAGLSLIQEGSYEDIDLSVLSWLGISAFMTLLAYPLIPLLERFFGFTSAISLVELSDMNRPLLRQLANKAPGTLQHSLQVANLSEEAARAVGANHLLVKVAALYHDVGKTLQPDFFIENQSVKSPHLNISDKESAKIIISHVPEGVKMAKKARLPNLLIDFIKSHHGTTRVEYFYRNYIKDHPEEEVDEQEFRYPGPKPVTKEETILMLADSIEAACKSLKNPTEAALLELIDKIITGKIAMGQLEDSELTFSELETCKTVFQQLMRSVHHVRIEYPEEEKSEE
ncbi:MAG: HDIG domain-containing protein [Phaeodactylibacter sp.]|uniref:HD family phosphohydrolase n=1 Tax=Phaeodactylibacter sp. TaxID=1940289 RepID=UPI0032ED0960